MEHFTFLWQIVVVALSFTTIVVLIQKYAVTKKKVLLIFICSIVLILIRTVIFAIARYGKISSFFILPGYFAGNAMGGLVYAVLVFTSHFLLLMGMNRLIGRRVNSADLFFFGLASAYSLFMYVLILTGFNFGKLPCRWVSITAISTIPFMIVKSVLFYNALKLSAAVYRDKGQKDKIYLYLFFLTISIGQLSDGIFYFYEPWRPVTLSFAVILTFSGFLIMLPIIVNRLFKEEFIARFNMSAVNILCSKFDLIDDDKELIMKIVRGKSNKEIAYENDTTLSIIKHRIYRLYQKCSINSRWELINLLIN